MSRWVGGPTVLEVTIRRYRCTGCAHVWRQDTTRAAEPRAKLSRRGLRWALEAIVCQHLTVARVAEGLGVAWNTAKDAVLADGKRGSSSTTPSGSTGCGSSGSTSTCGATPALATSTSP